MKTTTVLVLSLFALKFVSFGQCIEREKITYGGDWDFVHYIHRCPTYNFAVGGDTSKNWNVLTDPIDINQAPKPLSGIKQQIENKMKEFSGEEFFSKIKFSSVGVVYPNMLQAFIDSGRQDVTLKYCKAKYFFYYEFQPDTIATYHIGIAVNDQGKIISKFNFPPKAYYRPLMTTYNYCDLIEIARKVQPNIDPIKEISLEYDKNEKLFYWQITQEIVNKKAGLNYFNQVLIDASDFTKTKVIKGNVRVVF